VGVEKGNAQDDPGSIPGSVHTGSKAHPASHPMCIGRFSPGSVQRLGHETHHSPRSKVKRLRVKLHLHLSTNLHSMVKVVGSIPDEVTDIFLDLPNPSDLTMALRFARLVT
jgi:hypothetical protein